MPNPWDRQERGVYAPEDGLRQCPVCWNATDRLKQYNYVEWFFFYFIGVAASETQYRACPRCMRKFIVRRCAYNIIPANLFWFLFVLPYGLLLICRTFQRGHSPELHRLTPPPTAPTSESESADGFPIVVGGLVGWVPCFGLPIGIFAFVVSLKHTGWKKWVGRWALLSAAITHGTFLILAFIK